MASDEHKKLAAFIKETHNHLRRESRKYGPDEAWERHLSRTEVLQNYATTMQELATTHWDEQIEEPERQNHCRNKWIRSQCYKYFFNGGKEEFDAREIKIRNKIIDSHDNVECTGKNILEPIINDNKTQKINGKIKLLDVGSCYNPLAVEERFEVTPIDLAPFSDTVLQCDFLNVKISTETIFSENGRKMEQLKEASFDAIVFSLLLEYFPSPEQRFDCCQKAYRLLKSSGVLLIITPDSNHVGANAKVMKSWRLVLSRLGFMRIVYDKLKHLHCIGFRKCADRAVAARWSNLQNISNDDKLFQSENKIYIPQDFQHVSASENSCEKIVYDPEELVSVFDELPCANYVSE